MVWDAATRQMSIVVIASELEGNRKANARMVAKALHDNHIRMFGLALGPVETKNSVASHFVTSTIRKD